MNTAVNKNLVVASPIIRLRRLIGLFSLIQIGLTHPLWLTTFTSLNPRIPWFEAFCHTNPLVDLTFVVVMIWSGLWMLFGTATLRTTVRSSLLFVISAVVCNLFDQHRLQPWMLQFVVSSALIGLLPTGKGLRLYQWFVCSIYLYSAISKFDAAFLETHGEMLLNGLVNGIGIDTQFWEPQTRKLFVLALPTGELLVAVLLLWNRTRFAGLLSSVAMHIALIWTLGPTGLNHEYGVLGWNTFFILQNLILFGRAATSNPLLKVRSPSLNTFLANAIAAIAILCPILENWNHYDHWPAWAVYCSRPAQVRILIEQSALSYLPAEIQKLTTAELMSDESQLSLDRWSFETRYCPVYPQLRYRLALALVLLKDVPDDAVRIEIRQTPDRWTGQRELIQHKGKKEVAAYCERFSVNTKPMRGQLAQ